MSDLVTRLSVLAEDDGDRYPAHVKKLAEAAASRIAALEAQLAEALKALEPFSDMAGEMFARGWNASDVGIDTETCMRCGGPLCASDDDDGQPNEQQEWNDYDPDC